MNNEQNTNTMKSDTRKVATPAEAMELLNIKNNYKNYGSFMDVVYERGEGYTAALQMADGSKMIVTCTWSESADKFIVVQNQLIQK